MAGKYKTGIHVSPKSNKPIRYRSSWEYTSCLFFDTSDDIVSYEYESVVIPYVSNKRTGKIRRYFPDFLVSYKDGTVKLIEVKREDKVLDKKVVKKLEAAQAWCQTKGIIFEVWTNKKIESIKKT